MWLPSQYPTYTASKHGVIGMTKCATRGGDMEVNRNADDGPHSYYIYG